MLKHLIFILPAIFIISACVGNPAVSGHPAESNYNNYWVSLPKQNSLVIWGVSGRQTKHELEIQNAKQDAAKKVSISLMAMKMSSKCFFK